MVECFNRNCFNDNVGGGEDVKTITILVYNSIIFRLLFVFCVTKKLIHFFKLFKLLAWRKQHDDLLHGGCCRLYNRSKFNNNKKISYLETSVFKCFLGLPIFILLSFLDK